MKRMLLMVAVLFFSTAGLVWAHGGGMGGGMMGSGNGMMGSNGYGSNGYGMMGNNGYGMMGNNGYGMYGPGQGRYDRDNRAGAHAQRQDRAQSEHDRITGQLRRDMRARQDAILKELDHEKPDRAKLRQLRKEMSMLQDQLDQEQSRYEHFLQDEARGDDRY